LYLFIFLFIYLSQLNLLLGVIFYLNFFSLFIYLFISSIIESPKNQKPLLHGRSPDPCIHMQYHHHHEHHHHHHHLPHLPHLHHLHHPQHRQRKLTKLQNQDSAGKHEPAAHNQNQNNVCIHENYQFTRRELMIQQPNTNVNFYYSFSSLLIFSILLFY
jgi:hypothetical protein